MSAAMRAASTGCSAWARGWGGSTAATGVGGGALGVKHKGQSMPIAPISTVPSSVCTSSLMAPVPEQITSKAWGCTSGDAMAKPTDAMNHASTHRRSAEKVRRAVMGGDDTGELIAQSAIARTGMLRICRKCAVNVQ